MRAAYTNIETVNEHFYLRPTVVYLFVYLLQFVCLQQKPTGKIFSKILPEMPVG